MIGRLLKKRKAPLVHEDGIAVSTRAAGKAKCKTAE
jgi:hypothetical protein